MSYDAKKYYHERYFRLKSEHKCVYCGEPLAESRKKLMCESCQERQRAAQRKHYLKKKREVILKAFHQKQSGVIRCRDCAVPHNQFTGCSKLNGFVTSPDFYCALAEPKGGVE